jgi:hypothetical protein
VHIVTKILIVFGAILCILLSALTVSLAGNTEAVRGAYAAERDAKIAAQAELAVERSESAKLTAAAAVEKEPLVRVAQEAEAKLRALETERNTLKAEKSEAQGQVDTLRNQFNELTVTTQTQASLVKSLKDELDASRKASLDTAKQLAEVIERLNESERLRGVLDQTARSLREQLEETKLASAAGGAAAGAPASSSVARAVELAGARVSGRIVRTFKSPAGEEMASVNIGSGTGLKVNTKLNIVRDGFVASLVITAVDVSESVGRIEKLGREVEVRADDLVLSRLD